MCVPNLQSHHSNSFVEEYALQAVVLHASLWFVLGAAVV